jgi:hypothetical protein
MATRTASDLTPSEKIAQGLVLTPAEIEYVQLKPTLDANEASWRLGISRRYLIKELAYKGVLPATATPPGSRKLLWSKQAVDAAQKGDYRLAPRQVGRSRAPKR